MIWPLLATVCHADPATPPIDLGDALVAPRKASWDPKGKAIAPFVRGDNRVDQKLHAEAVPLLLEALEVQPGCGKCLSSLGWALKGLEQWDHALQVAELMIALFPERANGEWLAASANIEARRFPAGIESAGALLAKEPAIAGWWCERNDALQILGRADEARALLEGAVVAGLPAADVACMRVTLSLTDRDLAAANEGLATCAESQSGLYRYAQGSVALAEGRVAEAQSKFSQGGIGIWSRLTLAWLRADEGRYDLAFNVAEGLVEEEPWALDAQVVLAEALHGLGRVDEADAVLDAVFFGDGWAERHREIGRDDVIIASLPDWPEQVVVRAIAVKLRILDAAGDADGAAALRAAAVEVHGDHPSWHAPAPATTTAAVP